MFWFDAIAYFESLLTIAALIGAIWSAFEFVKGYRRKAEDERAAQSAKWRRVSVHKILHTSPHFLPVSDILDKLKSSSFDEDFKINKKELTERELRAVLLEGIEKGYFQQLHGDTYGISSRDFVMDNAFATLRARDLLHDVYDLLCFAKGPLSTEELLERIEQRDIKVSDFEISMQELTSRHLVERQEDGRWVRKGN
ncbi:hypothetical protein [Ruegeria sp. Ofav3-42]|uniref:hypothetical protein n=1 Tax=Ruegeria sp. Ofav3-42 TaxID=2917759 RepID=UPI001EF5FA1F|nr:hypothetical protein [Ruegeria sp. Ofav3-42]MCG7519119.1 hypothetical protein [Ruegeria sp. Ofav3-42]